MAGPDSATRAQFRKPGEVRNARAWNGSERPCSNLAPHPGGRNFGSVGEEVAGLVVIAETGGDAAGDPVEAETVQGASLLGGQGLEVWQERGPGEASELVDPLVLEGVALGDHVCRVDRQIGKVDGLGRL